MNYKLLFFTLSVALFAISCKKEEAAPYEPPTEAKLIFKFKFDSTQERLNNFGEPADVADGHAAQSPIMDTMSAHYIELAPNANTPLGSGDIMYRAPELEIGGETAIDFEKAKLVANDSVFLEVPIKAIKPGDYEYLRVSISYQSARVKFYVDTAVGPISIKQTSDANIAGFIGYNTYIKDFKIGDSVITVNDSKKQGFWGFYTAGQYLTFNYKFATTGQAPEGATTVVNPIFATSPIPPGSCVVTAAFKPGKLTITGKEANDIVVEVSFSTNKSFEWTEVVNDGKWEPLKGENITDMGIRGMIPTIK
jgi:hypothetical protein